MLKILGMFTVAMLALGAVFIYPRLALTEAGAAQKAASCLGWPEEITSQVPNRFHPGTTLSQPQMLLYGHASMVRVSWNGTCSEPEDTQVVSEPLMHLPPMAMIPASRQNYVIYFMGGSAQVGYRFLAARAGMASVPLPSEQPSKGRWL